MESSLVVVAAAAVPQSSMRSCVQVAAAAVVVLRSMKVCAGSFEESWCRIAGCLAGHGEGWETLIYNQREQCIEAHDGSPHYGDGALAA